MGCFPDARSYDLRPMRSASIAIVAALLVACAPGAGSTTSTATPSTTVPPGSTTVPPVECPPAPYELGFVPAGVGAEAVDPDEIELDVWTVVGGTNTTFYGREDGSLAIALIRGTLPAVDWPGQKGEVEIDGTAGVVGPHPDGTWVAAWYEEPGEERCNLYTMVFYAPWDPSDVEAVILGMNRVGG